MKPIITSSSDGPLSSLTVILLFLYIVGSVFVLLAIKKIYFHIRYRKRYYIFPKIDSKGIANTAMVISISISIILLLTFLTAGVLGILFRVYPGWRVTIESILIKIGGLIFGPIIGIFIGACTDLLTVALTAGMFHYGFFFSAVAYGFFAGLVRTLINYSKKNSILFTTLATVIAMIVMVLTNIYVSLFTEVFQFDFLGIGTTFSKFSLCAIIDGTVSILLIILWSCSWIAEWRNNKIHILEMRIALRYGIIYNWFKFLLRNGVNANRNAIKYLRWKIKIEKGFNALHDKKLVLRKESKSYSKNWFFALVPVVMLLTFGEPLVDIIMMPLFDKELGGGMPLEYWVPVRTLMFPMVVLINFVVIYPVYKTITPILKYDYRDNLVESSSIKLMD